MKKILLFSFVALLSCPVFSQQKAVIAVDKNNFFYAGIENPVSIAVPGVPADQIKLEVKGATIKRTGDSEYSLSSAVPNSEVTIHVMSVNGDSKTDHGTCAFRVKAIPAPDCYLGGYKLSENPVLVKATLNANSKLMYRSSITEMELPVPVITSFNISFKNNDSELFEKSVMGNTIPGDVITAIMNLKDETIINIDDIKVSQDNKTQEMPACSFIVK